MIELMLLMAILVIAWSTVRSACRLGSWANGTRLVRKQTALPWGQCAYVANILTFYPRGTFTRGELDSFIRDWEQAHGKQINLNTEHWARK